jgi:transposase-like protein
MSFRSAILLPFLVISAAAADFKEVQPLLKEFCISCHSTEKQKGDLDLERFATIEDVKKEPEIWQKALEQMADGEMPPKDKPQLSAEQKHAVSAWITGTLETIGRENAGDPGPVVLRRLSNMEYTYTLRDLTGVVSLDPTREFPADGAAGEGFTNAGAALVMSPALFTKYLDAAKEVAAHAVFLPHGMEWSGATTPRDWSEEKMAAIRAFYARYSDSGGAQPVNLQGIQFDTNAGGRLPVEKYLTATFALREGRSVETVAAERGLNVKYLTTLWKALNDRQPSLLLDLLRARWSQAKPEDVEALAAFIGQWQRALWRFTTIGHIGKRDGPKAWQEAVNPLTARRDIRFKLPASAGGPDVTLYLTTTDAGDGAGHDEAIWENARLVAPGRADLPLREVRGAVSALFAQREKVIASAEKCLRAAAAAQEKTDVTQLAQQHGVEPALLGAWLSVLGIGGGEVRIESHLKGRAEKAEAYDFIKGWTGADALSVLANSSDQHVRIPGNMKPHSVAVHPSPKLRVAVGWQSPVSGPVRVSGTVQHAHPECGNGVAWVLELRRGGTRQSLATGIAHGGNPVPVGPLESVSVQPGDVISMVIGPRDGNHSCDLTAVDLELAAGDKKWSLAGDVSPNILAGNPNGPWHFYSEPDNGASTGPVLPAGSLLAKWREAPPADKISLGGELAGLLARGPEGLAKDAPDAALYRLLTSLNGPLVRSGAVPGATGQGAYGLDPALFSGNDLIVHAPSVIEVKLPAELAEGCELVAAATLRDPEGSVQVQAGTTRPSASGLAPGAAREAGGKGTWSDGQRPLDFEAPILVADDSDARRRVEAALNDFRSLFPVALCYPKIVPVDEVVTLTLFFREDTQLRRLMLDDAQAAELDRLWAGLTFVSQEPLKLVDAFDQLWQFATQDADPSAFEPLREPIKQRAVEFRKTLIGAEPKHIQGVLDFAPRAWRRPLTDAEQTELRSLYTKLRDQELSHEAAVRLLLARVLVAPAFLYRGETAGPGRESQPVTDRELATRLSYFLWSSAPDAELTALAAANRLHEPDVLKAQARRLMRDVKVQRLALEFGCQWLHVRDLASLDEKSERHFPTFTALRGAMQEECERFFTDFFQHDRSVLSLLDADHTFVNGPLAQHYGLPAKGDAWQRVDGLQAQGRGGLLGFAATLSKQSGASRTSPILRGNWVCEVLLGDRLPRPPKGVPVLPEEAPAGLTERQLIEKHSNDPKCSGCHLRIDPFGFTLEAFDAIGRRREADTKVTLPNGTALEGLNGLRHYLVTQRREDFVKQFCRKLLGYALGRGVLLSDRPLLDEMGTQLQANGFAVSRAVELIVQSRQFREVRGQAAGAHE